MHEEEKVEWAGKMIECLVEMKKNVDEAKSKEIVQNIDEMIIEEFEKRYDLIIEEGLSCELPLPAGNVHTEKKRGRKKRSKSFNLLDRLKRKKKSVLAFMHDFRVPFDNNLSERDIRMMKLKQKISGTFRSEDGAHAFCRIRSYISTVRKQGLNTIESIKNVFLGKPFIPTCAG